MTQPKKTIEQKNCINTINFRKTWLAKTCKRFTKDNDLPQTQQQTQIKEIQDEEIRKNLNLPYLKGIYEKLLLILRSCKVRSPFYTKKYKVLSDPVTNEYKYHIGRKI